VARTRALTRAAVDGVVLVCMPFGPAFSPSLGLSLLRGSLLRHGIDAAIRYFSLDFAERLGQHFYFGVASAGRPPVIDLAGEWIFAAALAPSTADHEYLDRVLRDREAWRDRSVAPRVSRPTIARIAAARAQVEPFLAACLDELIAVRPRIVGFTSLFQQHVASLALARRLKEALPDTVIVFGGANCEGVMGAETIRQFAFVDAVVSGEGEIVFPEIVKRVLASQSIDGIPGVRTRRSVASAFAFGNFANAAGEETLDNLPFPDFSDYLEQFERSRLSRRWQPTMPFETSRGCWWGAKHHCTFCGLNGATMAFRSKSAARAVDELTALAARHPGCEVQVVDTILDMGYFNTFLPELARRRPDVKLFYETKSNLRKDQVRLLRDAGVATIQPGIESFSDPVLAIMRKGVTALQNIQLLKWCKEFGVAPVWNLIWGFPGEPAASYPEMTALTRRLTHLPPPDGYEGLRLDRFSPNFVDADARGFADVRPIESYRYIYALPDAAIRNLAYFFTFRYANGDDPGVRAAPLIRGLTRWKRAARHSDLFSIDVDGRLLIWDFRHPTKNRFVELGGIDRRLYLACDQIAELAALERIGRDAGAADDADVRRRLSVLERQDLLVEMDGRFLALAIPAGEYHPRRAVVSRLLRDVRARASGGIAIRVEPRVRASTFGAVHVSTAPDGTLLVSSTREPAWGRPRSPR